MPLLVAVAGVSVDAVEDKGPIFSLLVLHVKMSVFLIQVVTEHVLQESTTVPVTSEDGHFRLQFIKVCKGRLLSCLCKRHLEPDSLPQIKAIKLLYSCLSFTYSLKAYKSTANNYCNFG